MHQVVNGKVNPPPIGRSYRKPAKRCSCRNEKKELPVNEILFFFHYSTG
jgi:hypothetical protein